MAENMKIKVSFSDLGHTNHSCKVIPYGSAMVASYLIKHFGHMVEVDIFKNPQEFIEYLERSVPKIVCFSNYIWNINLSCEFAKRIKKQSPDTITVFGGPNYPLSLEEQENLI